MLFSLGPWPRPWGTAPIRRAAIVIGSCPSGGLNLQVFADPSNSLDQDLPLLDFLRSESGTEQPIFIGALVLRRDVKRHLGWSPGTWDWPVT